MNTVTDAMDEFTIHWARLNRLYLDKELERLRLLLRRRVLWLRHQWHHDPIQNFQAQVISEAQADWLLAGEDWHAEAHFYQHDAEAAAISDALADLANELTMQQAALTEAKTPPALAVLAHLCDLTAFERDVLLLCLAPELDPLFERLYAYVQDDMTRKYATPHLALTLLGQQTSPATYDSDDGGASLPILSISFSPQAPLRHWHLVTLDAGSLPVTMTRSCPLRLDERIAGYLQGINRPDERVRHLLKPLSPTPLAPAHQALADRLVRALTSAEAQVPWPILNLIGPSGIGKQTVAQAVCEGLGLQLSRLDVRPLLASDAERHERLRLLEREALLQQHTFYIDTAQIQETPEANPTTALTDIIERFAGFLIVGSPQRWRCEEDMMAVHVPKPDASGQRMIWQEVLGPASYALNGHLDTIVQQFDFGPQAIGEAVAAAQSRAWLRSTEEASDFTADDLWQACREQASWHLDELAQRIEPRSTWDDIVLPEDVFRQLQEIAAQVAQRFQVYEVWGFGAKLSRGRGINALFAGPSGTGKTMAAEVLAHHLQLDLYRIDLAGVVSKYIGETEKNLRKVFDAAEQSGAILFFDEADALFGKRTEVKDSHDRYANIEINYLLQRMEEYRGLAILATNMKTHLDKAFLRRLRFLVDFPFPDARLRRDIWQRAFPSQATVQELDYASLSRLNIPGGNIKNIALNAAFLAAGAGETIDMSHVIHAARREYVKIDKMVLESEFGSYYSMVKR